MSVPRYDDIVRTAGWAGSARAAGRRRGPPKPPAAYGKWVRPALRRPAADGGFSTLLRQSGLRPSTGGVLATKTERKMLASTCLYSLYAWLAYCYKHHLKCIWCMCRSPEVRYGFKVSGLDWCCVDCQLIICISCCRNFFQSRWQTFELLLLLVLLLLLLLLLLITTTTTILTQLNYIYYTGQPALASTPS